MKKFLFALLLCCFSSAYIDAQLTVSIGVNGTSQDTVGLCGIGDDVTLVAIADSGTAPYTYTWTDASGQISLTGADSIVIFTSAIYGSFWIYCQATDNLSNTSIDSILVIVHPNPTLTYPLNQTICKGNCTTLTCSTTTGNLLVWYLGTEGGTILGATYCPPNSLGINVCPTSTTTYWATSYDTTTGCSKSKPVKVTVSLIKPTAKASPGSLCIGGSSNLSVLMGGNGTPPYTYSWSPTTDLSNPNISNPVASPTVTTTYCVTVTDHNGCTGTSCVTINLPSPPVVKDDTTICHGGCATLFAVPWVPARLLIIGTQRLLLIQ